jgi:AcrR family transcriptional regulator
LGVIGLATWRRGDNFDAFHALEAGRQARIIDAALAEFAAKGFQRASTNVIAQRARIGKGMLFYYFGSKEELFDFLCQYTIAFAEHEYIQRVETGSGDFLRRYQAAAAAKRRVVRDFPEVIGFFESFYRAESAPQFARFAVDIARLRRQLHGKIYDGLDYSLFREDLDGQVVVQYLKWLFDGYEADTAERFRRGDIDLTDESSVAAEWARFYAFTDDLRKTFYQDIRPPAGYQDIRPPAGRDHESASSNDQELPHGCHRN